MFTTINQTCCCFYLKKNSKKTFSFYRFKMRHILSEASEEWQGEKGRISNSIATSLASESSQYYVTFCCICGSMPFNNLSLQILKENGFHSDSLFCFQG